MIEENWSVAAVTSHSDAGYTEIKSHLQALLSAGFGTSCETEPMTDQFLIPGRSAAIKVGEIHIGRIGEVMPFALEKLKMRVPVSAFEIDLDRLLSLSQKEKNSRESL